MTGSMWRSKARFVGFFDLVRASLELVALVFGTGYITGIKQHEKLLWLQNDTIIAAMDLFWPAVVLIGVLILYEIKISMTLIKATEIHMEPAKSLELSRKWRDINIVFIIVTAFLQLFLIIVFPEILVIGVLASVIGLFIRGLFLYFVHSYIEELEAFKICNDDGPLYSPS